MRFILLVKATKDSEAGVMPSTEMLTAMGKFNEEMVKAGILLAGEGLHPSSRGARVHFDGAKRTVVDGPFAETKELVAGFWIIQVKSLEEAIEWVRRCPNPHDGPSDIEIRRIFEAEDFGAELTPELREQEERLRAQAAKGPDMIRYTLIVVAALVAGVLLVAASRPDTFRIERSATIAAPPATVYALIDDFHQWGQWSPWEKLDPAMQRTFSGQPRGIGTKYAWQSDGKAGAGSMEIVDAVPASRIGIDLRFLKPIAANNRATFTLTPEAGGTRVVWVMDGASPFISKVFGVFVSMDRLIGRDFEAGLATLKSVAERAR